jgi:hypothetical protein
MMQAGGGKLFRIAQKGLFLYKGAGGDGASGGLERLGLSGLALKSPREDGAPAE